ncbi:nuclease-related domain-containing protein, partial [Rathayibacter iranicus]|uniref:nuclease-related domain-containing protein n=1 Tax=Rathayibacter iranicus TaxID=59737 RepID=UPI0015E285A1
RPRLNGAALVNKGKRGVQASIEALEARGDTLVGKEITIDVGGVRTRMDILARTPSGELYFIEAKNGLFAKLTKNQQIAFDLIRQGKGAIPAGHNAQIAGLEPGKPLEAMEIKEDRWDLG